jgi:hypothetical protein
MTEEKFTELVNLYLDKEISERGLADLQSELADNDQREALFQERCRMHQAIRLAMNPGKSNRSGSRRSSRSGQPSQPRRAASTSTRVDDATFVSTVPRWIMGTGVAACFALGITLLIPVFRDTTEFASQPELEGVKSDELVEEDPLDRIGRNEMRRFASIQDQRAANRRASIAAQLRLMGLRPEFTPDEKHLRPVSVAATHRPEPARSHADLLAEVQKISAMPATKILRVESLQAEPPLRWPSGFQSSLASFK